MNSELFSPSSLPLDRPARVAVVDDEPLFLYLISDVLKESGHEVTSFPTPEELLASYRPGLWDVIVTDHYMPRFTGIELLSELRLRGYDQPIVLLTGAGDEALAVSALKGGAFDYVVKQPGPETVRDIARAVHTAAKAGRLERENRSLRHEIDRLADAARSVGDALITLDPSGQVTFASDAAAQLMGVDTFELVGKSLFDLLRFDYDLTPHDHILTAAYEGCFRGIAHQGQGLPVLVTLSPLRGTEQREGRCDLVALVVDASLWQQRAERRETELATTLIHRRLEGVGSLAARMAHEINNPTTWLSLNLETISDEIAEQLEREDAPRFVVERDMLERWKDLLQGCLSGVERISSHTGRLLMITRQDASATRPIKPLTAAYSAFTLLGRDAANTQVINLIGESEFVAAEETTLAHAVAALLENAFDAVVPASGFTDRTKIEGVRLVLRRRGPLVEFAVEDAGAGIPVTSPEQLFEPFFTTKADRGGTGLGLPMARIIARRFGGDVDIRSLVGESPWKTASVLSVPLCPTP